MRLLHTFGDMASLDKNADSYKVSHATRGVVFDDVGNVAVVHSTVAGYYEAPGGTVEEGETIEQGLVREMKEETGCDIEILGELGQIDHVFSDHHIRHTYCYLAKVVGPKGELILEDDEKEYGVGIRWMPLEEALNVVINSRGLPGTVDEYNDRNQIIFKEAMKNKLDLSR